MGEIARNHSYIIDLEKPLIRQSGVAFAEGDNGGDVFAFALQRNGAAIALYPSPEITGYFIRPDETTVVLTGDGTGSSGTIRLPLACYALSGRCTLTVKATHDGVTTTILILDGFVKRTTTNVEPGSGGSSSGGVVTVAGAVRYDTAQDLTDEQKAQARANIGVTSTGADISGLIDDDINSYETVWSSNKVIEMLVDIDSRADVGTLTSLTTADQSNLVAAINEVNAKAGSGTSSSGGGTAGTFEQGWLTSSGEESTSDQHCRTVEYIPKADAYLTMPASIAAKIILYNYTDGAYEYQTTMQMTAGQAYTQRGIEDYIGTLPGVTYTHVKLLFAYGSVDTPSGTITPAELNAAGVAVTKVTLSEIYQRLIECEAKLAAM